MSFWDYPGQYAGPYGRPARPGVFSNIVNAAGALASLANTGTKMYQGYQEGQRRKALDPITMAQVLHPEQPYQPTEEQAAEIQKRTGYAMPRGAAGGVAPIGPAAPKTLDEAILRGMLTPQEAEMYRKLHSKQYPILDIKGNVTGYGEGERPFQPRPVETPQEKEDRAVETSQRKRNIFTSGPGRSGGTGKISDFEKSYQQALAAESGLTREQFRVRVAKEIQEGKMGVPKPLPPQSTSVTTKKTPYRSEKTTTQKTYGNQGADVGQPPFPAEGNKDKYSTSPDGSVTYKSDGKKWNVYTGD